MTAAPTISLESSISKIETDGFVVFSGVYSREQVDSMLRAIAGLCERLSEEAVLRSGTGSVCAARNVLELWPRAADVWRRPPLPEFLTRLLGAEFGLVRVLFFDKPPERSWTLPWHRDMTIAVRDNSLPSQVFRKPTHKAGVPHVEAPRNVLERMLTARIHLDDVTDENGPLKVQAGSHRVDEFGEGSR